jgi:HPt (histidine-containing phosphotransfer) domain-containing protein
MKDSADIPAEPPLQRQADDAPPFLVNALLDRFTGYTQMVELVLDAFEKQAAGYLAAISRKATSEDRAAAARTIHSLKGTAELLSAAALAEVVSQLEEEGSTCSLTEADKIMARLIDEVRRCVAYLPAARQRLRATSSDPTLRGTSCKY